MTPRSMQPIAARVALAVVAALATLAVALTLLAALTGSPASAVYTAADGSDRAAVLRRPDEELGYALQPGQRIRASRRQGDRVLYDVVYTIDEHGLRSMPTVPGKPAVVFFGCSFTFGEGVGDSETLPALVAGELGGMRRVVNAGVPGYGPHQMLRTLELGRLDPLVPAGVALVVYQAIPTHVARASGRAIWDVTGPLYRLEGDGLRFAGPFHGPIVASGLRLLNRLVSAGGLPRSLAEASAPGSDDDERWLRLVTTSADLVREKWRAPLIVLLWDDDSHTAALGAELERRGIEVVPVSQILPRGARTDLVLPVDGHPNGLAYAALARALSPRLVPPTARSDVSAAEVEGSR